LRTGGPTELLVLFVLTPSLWLGIATPRTRRLAKSALAAGLLATLALGAKTAAYWLRHSRYVDMSKGVNVWEMFRILGWAHVLEACYGLVAGAVAMGLLASVCWSAMRGEKLSLWSSFQGAARCFWPLLIFFTLTYFPNNVFVPWLAGPVRFQELLKQTAPRISAEAVSGIGYTVVAWTIVVSLAGLPFPLLVVAEHAGVWSALKRLGAFYRERWQRLVVLFAVTVALITVCSFPNVVLLEYWRAVLPWTVVCLPGGYYLCRPCPRSECDYMESELIVKGEGLDYWDGD
jgi:hypothetical protein